MYQFYNCIEESFFTKKIGETKFRISGGYIDKSLSYSLLFTGEGSFDSGTLSHPENHQVIQFKTKERGLYESGFQIDKIIKIKYLNIVYLGFGAGVYYRYGSYSLKKTENNLAVKLSITFSTK